MQLGLIGLGRMGGNMRERIRRAGHEVIGFDMNPAVRDVGSLATLVKKLAAPRVVWVMVPAGAPTRDTVTKLAGPVSYTHLRAPETVLDLVCRLLLAKKKQKQYKETQRAQHLYNSTIYSHSYTPE
mgnify:CR=1 FL=1